MKNQILLALSILSLFITFSSPAYAQLLDPCLNGLTEGCLGDGGGGGWTPPPVPNQPAVTYVSGTTGDVYILTREKLYEGIPGKIHLVRSGSKEVEEIKIFPLNTIVTEFKMVENKIFYNLYDQYTAAGIRYLQEDALGKFVEASLFKDLVNEDDGKTILSKQYSGLTVLNGSAYIKRSTFTFKYPEECASGLVCVGNDGLPVFVGRVDVFLKQDLSSGIIQDVSSIPGESIQSSRYSFSIITDNIYRTDADTGQTTPWLLNNNQAGHNLQLVGVSEGYLLFRSTSGYDDMITNLIAVKITDDVPHPELRLATNLAGVVYVAYQVESSVPDFSIATFNIYQKGIRSEKYSLSEPLETNRFTELDVTVKVNSVPELIENGGEVEIFMVAEGPDEKLYVGSIFEGLLAYVKISSEKIAETLNKNESERVIKMRVRGSGNKEVLPKLSSEYEGKVKIKTFIRLVPPEPSQMKVVVLEDKEINFSIKECDGFTHEGNDWITKDNLKFDSQSNYKDPNNRSHINGVNPYNGQTLISSVGCNLTSLTNALKVLGGRNYLPGNSGELDSFRSPFINYLAGIATANNLDHENKRLLDPQQITIFNNAQYDECLNAACTSKITHKAVYHQTVAQDFKLTYKKQALNADDNLFLDNVGNLGNYFALRGFRARLASETSLFGYGNSSKSQTKESICGSGLTKVATGIGRGIAVLRTLRYLDAVARHSNPDSSITSNEQHFVLAIGTTKSIKNPKREVFQVLDPLEKDQLAHNLDETRVKNSVSFNYDNVVKNTAIFGREGFYPNQEVATFYRFIDSLKLINTAYAQESNEISTFISTNEIGVDLIIKNKLGTILYDSKEEPLISHENGFTKSTWGGESAPDCDELSGEICSLPERFYFIMNSTPLEELEFIFSGGQSSSFDVAVSTQSPSGELLETKTLTLAKNASGIASLIEYGGVDPIIERNLKIEKIKTNQASPNKVVLHLEGVLEGISRVLGSDDVIEIYAEDLLNSELNGSEFDIHKNFSSYRKLNAKDIEIFTIDHTGRFVLFLNVIGKITPGNKTIYIRINNTKYIAKATYLAKQPEAKSKK